MEEGTTPFLAMTLKGSFGTNLTFLLGERKKILKKYDGCHDTS